MAKNFNDRIWVAIDIGTTKICVLVARGTSSEHLELIGIGKSPSQGLRRGIVVDIAKTVESIRSAAAEAQLMAGISIDSAVIGISGAHIQSRNLMGAVPIKKGEVRLNDIANAMNAAQAIALPEGQQILHVLPQFFTIDGQEPVFDPLGMYGVRLEVKVHIITGSVASVQNLIKCCEMAGIKATDIVLEQLASAAAVLSDDERELGVGVLDIGGGTSDFAIYKQGGIRHTKVIPIAGNLFTSDLAICLNATLKDAERVKQEFGVVHLTSLHKESDIIIEMIHGGQQRSVHMLDLIRILQPRAQELLEMVHQEISNFNLKPLMRTGLVLTGGSSLLRGLPLLTQELLALPARVGCPRSIGVLPEALTHPMYATSYGLLLHEIHKKRQNKLLGVEGPMIKQVFSRMKSWVSDFF